MMKRLAIVLFMGICAFLGGFVANVAPRWNSKANAQLSIPTVRLTASKELRAIEMGFQEVAKKASPTVVSIEAKKPAARGRNRAVEESGSGVLIEITGQRAVFAVTNNHVIQNASANQITVSLHDGRLLKPDRVWTDPESDLAVLRLPQTSGLTPAKFGDSDRVRIGQWVIAIGSPFGLNQTVSHGILSARGRGQVSLGETIRIKDFLQTDAAINPGSSGGPLFNLDSEVIGINTAIASSSGSSSGVAFSIPINLAKRIAIELVTRGRVARGYLGLQLASSFEPDDALRLGLRRAQGAWIETIYRNTPAADAGLQGNDVVMEVNDTTIRDENHFINLISDFRPGQRIQMRVWRSRKLISMQAVIGDWDRFRAQIKN